MAHYKFHNDSQSSVLTYEQVKRLDSVMDQTVPIHGRGNFPTLHVKLKDLIILVKHKLQKEHSIEIRDVRLNGGCASYVLAPENSHYNDLDLIFGTDLSDENQFDVIRDVVLECLREFIPREQQQHQQAEAHELNDNNEKKLQDTNQQSENNEKKQTTPQMPPSPNQTNTNHNHHPNLHQLNNCSIKEAYVHKMVKVNDDDRWSLISLGAQQQQQSEGICGHGGNGQAVGCPKPALKVAPLHEQQINNQANVPDNHHHLGHTQPAQINHNHHHYHNHQHHHNSNQHHHHHHQFSVTLAYENENQAFINQQQHLHRPQHGQAANNLATGTDNIMSQPITYIHHEHLDQRNHHYHHQHLNHHNNHHNNHNSHHHHHNQPKQFPNSIELKFVDRMRRKFEFSVDSFQIILDSLLQFYDYAPQSTISMQKKKKLISSSLSSTSCSSSSSSSHDDGICDECSSSPIIDDNDDVVGYDDRSRQQKDNLVNNNRSSSSSTLYYDDEVDDVDEEEEDDDDDNEARDIDLFNNISRGNYNYSNYNNKASSCSVISENFYPTVIGRSEYGNFKEALFHLERRLIATRSPEEIRGGGLLKYCNLLVKNYKPKNVYQFRTLERYMCSRFFIDFSEISQQRAKLESYLANHFSDDPKQKFDYLTILHNVVQRSTVCLMNHELRLTLDMIRDLAYKLNEQHNQQLQHHHHQHQQQQQLQHHQQQQQQSHHLRAQVSSVHTKATAPVSTVNTKMNTTNNGNKQQI